LSINTPLWLASFAWLSAYVGLYHEMKHNVTKKLEKRRTGKSDSLRNCVWRESVEACARESRS